MSTIDCHIDNSMVANGTLPEKLPADLKWETNDTDPEFSDPSAQRGGDYHAFMLSFPLTFRLVGPDSNGGFAGYLRALHLPTTDIHPVTLKPMPVMATHWAFGADGRSIYFQLNPKARWSDGHPITADDFLFQIYLYRSKFIVDPWYNDYYTKTIVDIRKYDDHTIGVAGIAPRPHDEMLYEYGVRPSSCHSHKLDKDWVTRTNFLAEPVSGPYRISKVKKGQYVEFERIDDCWGNEERFFKHRFNAKHVRIDVVPDLNIAYDYFLKGQLDSFPLNLSEYWHDKATGEAFDHGYIHKLWFYTDSPAGGAGLWLNVNNPLLADRNVRLGIAYSVNYQRVIETVLRGDFERSNAHFEGYGDYSNPNLRALPFDLALADAAFKAAGFTQRGPDGIRVRNGQRLSFQLSYGAPQQTDRLTVLRESAKQAGLELRLQLLDNAAAFKALREKKYEIASSGWAGGGLVPPFWEYYHSENADKPQTNNVTNYRDPVTDQLIDRFRASADRAERVQLAQEIEQRVSDAVVLVPSVRAPFDREGYWRWLKLPTNHGTRLTGYNLSSGLFDPLYDGLFWIDEQERQRTLAAMKAGQKLDPLTERDERYRPSSSGSPPTNP